jgi:sec-independent protein translocase protein TatA
MIGTTELIIIGLVILVLFGAAAIPKFARSLGKAKKEFQEGLKEGEGAEGSVEKGEVEDEKD